MQELNIICKRLSAAISKICPEADTQYRVQFVVGEAFFPLSNCDLIGGNMAQNLEIIFSQKCGEKMLITTKVFDLVDFDTALKNPEVLASELTQKPI